MPVPSIRGVCNLQGAGDTIAPSSEPQSTYRLDPEIGGSFEYWTDQERLEVQLQQLETKVDALLERSFFYGEQLMHSVALLSKQRLSNNLPQGKDTPANNSEKKTLTGATDLSKDSARDEDSCLVPPETITPCCEELPAAMREHFQDTPVCETHSFTQDESRILKRHTLERRSTVDALMDSSLMVRIVSDPQFDFLVAMVVLLNSILVGAQVSVSANNSPKSTFHELLDVLEVVCSVFFCFEFVLRVIALRWHLLDKKYLGWFLFDATLVCSTCVENVIYVFKSVYNAASMAVGIMQLLRVARIFRVVRMLRFLTKLQMMARMILDSMASLVWVFAFMVLFTYVFAIVLTQGAIRWKLNASSKDAAFYALVHDFFGTLPHTIYTLFTSAMGGVNWDGPASVAKQIGGVYFAIFLLFIFIALFSVLNIITGVVVDGAIVWANNDRSIKEVKATKQRAAYMDELQNVVGAMDTDGDEVISEHEWTTFCNSPQASVILSALDLEVYDALSVFRILDVKSNNSVSIIELVEGIDRFKGVARTIDLHCAISMLSTLVRQTAMIAWRVGAVDETDVPVRSCGVRRPE